MKFQKKDYYEKTNAERMKSDLSTFMSLIPGTVKIDTVPYRVHEKETLIRNGRTVMGYIDYAKSEVEIDKNISLANKKIVLAHEVVHGITVERDVKGLIAEEHYEKVVDEIAKGLVQVIRDNPEFVKFIV